MITLPDRIKNDLSGNLTSAEYLVAIKTDPVIYISTTKQMFDATEGDVYGGNLASMNESDWTLGDDWEYDNGSLSVIWEGETSGNAELRDMDGLVDGETYKVSFTIENFNNFEGTDDYNDGRGRVLIYANSNHGGENNSPRITEDGDYEYFVTLDESGGSFSNRIMIQTYNDPVEFKLSGLRVQGVVPVYYEDIDLKLSNIKEKIDLKTKKIQLSSMSLTFSNFPINDVRLSDKLGNGLGKEISVYLKTASCETLEDCIKVADLKVNRYNHDRNTVKISADDKWLESFYIDLPRTLLEKDKNTFENYHLKPVPILYGHLENAPALPYYEEGGEFSFTEHGVKILPDSSYLGGETEIQGIKQWNEYDSAGNLRSVEEMQNPNVLKIRLSDTTLAIIPIRPYINTRDNIRNLHNYSQYVTHTDYITINIPNIVESSDSNTQGLWCSYNSKLINSKVSIYSITGDGNYLQDSYVTGDGITMNHITTGYLTSVYTSHDIGILDFEFEGLSGVGLYKDEVTLEETPTDVHFLGNGNIKYISHDESAFGSYYFNIFSIYSPYTFDETINTFEEAEDNIATPNEWSFYSTFSDDIDLLEDNRRNKFRIEGLRTNAAQVGNVYYLSSFNSFFEGAISGDGYNTFKSKYYSNTKYPIINSNNVVLYYTPDTNGVTNPDYNPSIDNQADSVIGLETTWKDVVFRKYWKNKDIFLKDFFVNAKGRVGNELVGAKSVNAEIKVWYEGQDAPDDFTSNENKHLTELYKFLTDNKYKTKSINGETYELMLYSQNLDDEGVYMFDIDVNNFYASSDMTTGLHNEDYPVIYINNDPNNTFTINSSHQTGWIFEVIAKTFGNHYNFENDIMWMGGLSLVYGKKNIVNGVLEGITTISHDSLESFNLSNGSYNNSVFTGYSWIKWDSSLSVENPRELLEQPEDIISNLVTTEMNAGGVQIPEQTYSKFGFSINEQENSKDIIENICRQSELFFRYSPRDGQAIIDKIKKQYTAGDVDKTIETDRILKYSFNKTKIDDLCFGGCRVKWGWDYGKEEAIGVTEDIAVIDEFMPKYLTEYGLEYNENEIQEFKESGKYQLEVEAPYINNEATAEKFRNFLFQFYKNTHLTLKLTLALQDGIELEVGDIVAFDKDIGGLKPYGKSIADILGADGFSGYIQIDQQIFPYFLVTSVSKSLSKVDIEVMQMHNLTGIPIIYGCMLNTYLSYNPNATVHDQSMCGDLIVTGCMNQNASTYDPDANVHDESMCVYSPDIPIADIQVTVESEGIQGITYFYIDVGYNLHLSSSNSEDPDPIENPPIPVNSNGISNVEWDVGDVDMDGIGIQPPLTDLVAVVNELAMTDLVIPITSEYFYEGQQLVFTLVVTDGMGNQSNIVSTQVITIQAPVDQGDLGDVNMDGSVDVIDVVAMINHILQNTLLEGEALLRADIYQDGIIDVVDIIAIINMILEGEDN